MASNYWIKLYHEILHDPKMGRLPDNLWRRTIECFLMAGELNEGGYLPSCGDMAWQFRMNDETLAAELEELAKLGILELRDGRWFVVKFAERQAAMSNTERVQRFRESQQRNDTRKKKKRPEAPPKQPENEPGTNELPTRNESETNRSIDIDIDIDTESDEEVSPLPPLSNSPADKRTKAIADVSGYDLQLDRHRTSCESASAQLGRFTAEHILERYRRPNGKPPAGWNWYIHDWRGQKGQAPTPRDVVMTITTAIPEAQVKATGKAKDAGIPQGIKWD